MPEVPIPINCTNGSLTAPSTPVKFGRHVIRWTPGPRASVTGITFDAGDAPFTPPQEQTDGTWTSEDDNNNTSSTPETWTYTIHGSCSKGEPVAHDPEIINEPKGGGEDEEPGGPGGGG